jgi:hypothetical protein
MVTKTAQYEITATTPRLAAYQLQRFITRLCDYGEEAVVRAPKDSNYGSWEVVWESGPYEWAISGGLGGDIYEEEFQGTLYMNPPTFGFHGLIYVEAANTYTMSFHYK